MTAHFARTSLALMIAVMAAAGGAACDQASNPAGPSSHNQPAPAVTDTPGLREVAAAGLGADLAAVRRATSRFHDVAEAFAAGYIIPPNEPCVAIPTGAMGTHAPNPALIADTALDPTRPELLLYLRKPNGGMRLIGVEYLQAVELLPATGGSTTTWVSPDFANPTPWPSTWEVVSPTPTLFGQSFGDYHPGHTVEMPWHWDLHVWVWAHNPDGMFAPFNPSIRCEP